MLCVRPWSDAELAGRVRLKQGSKRFNSITKTIHFAHLGLLFIYKNVYKIYRLNKDC